MECFSLHLVCFFVKREHWERAKKVRFFVRLARREIGRVLFGIIIKRKKPATDGHYLEARNGTHIPSNMNASKTPKRGRCYIPSLASPRIMRPREKRTTTIIPRVLARAPILVIVPVPIPDAAVPRFVIAPAGIVKSIQKKKRNKRQRHNKNYYESLKRENRYT